MCRRRLAREHAGGKRYANRSADARFAVSNRLVADARLAHTDPVLVRREAFVDPRDLEPEQRACYWAGVRGYLANFGDRPGRLADLGWQTSLPDVGVDLVANVGLPLERADGSHELRMLKLGGRRTGAPLLDPVELRCALDPYRSVGARRAHDRRRRPPRAGGRHVCARSRSRAARGRGMDSHTRRGGAAQRRAWSRPIGRRLQRMWLRRRLRRPCVIA